jgi:hypothetical protein
MVDAGATDAGEDAGKDASTADASAADAGTCLCFDGGYLRAEVLVYDVQYDVQSGEQLGGFRFVAESSRFVDVASRMSEPDALVQPDFSFKIRKAFDEAAQKWVPSLTVGN